MKPGAAEAIRVRVCELCNREANLYCDSDAAFLCFHCDSKVHNANFLVARHLRRLLCRLCRFHLAGSPFSGHPTPSSLRQPTATCRLCSPDKLAVDDPVSSLSSPTSSTLSTTEMSSCTDGPHKAGSRERCRTAGIFEAKSALENWFKRLGMNDHLRGVVLSRATHALGCLCSGRMGKVVPSRVSLAASFWFGVRLCGDTSASTLHNLKKVEQLSGVPAKVIVAVESKLQHALRARRRFGQSRHDMEDLEEGWAEC